VAVAIVLGTADGQIVDRRVADERLRGGLDAALLGPGFVYAEDTVGTNGIGTTLVRRQPTLVQGDEHFADALIDVACAGAPIFDAATGTIRGVLAVTCPVTRTSDLMLALVARAARQIEERLMDSDAIAERLALRRFLQERRSAKGPFVLVTDRVVVPNAAADRLIDDRDDDALRECARRLGCSADGAELPVVLARGTVATVRAAPALVGADGGSTVLRIVPTSNGVSRDGVTRRATHSRFGWQSLTDTEHSVAELVADGLTNKQAAEHLFLSPHTVGFHLRSIFRKLDVRSRVELARLIVEQRQPA
jgi:DNA-binding CsgD family transcriptional regulator